MRQLVAVLLLVVLFVVLVGSRFQASDGDRLAAISRLTVGKVRNAMPPAVHRASPFDALRQELPAKPEDAVRWRLTADKRLAGIEIKVTGNGGVVTLRGVVPDAETKRLAVDVAENTVGVEQVMDELAVPVLE